MAYTGENAVFDDDPFLGTDAPSLDSLDFVQGEKPDGEKPYVVTFWSKLNKGDFATLVWLQAEVSEKFADHGVQVVAVCRDAKKSDVTKMVEQKQGKRFDELDITLTTDKLAFAFDEGGAVNAAYKAKGPGMAIGVGFTFVVKGGKVLWYEVFERGKAAAGQFLAQLQNILVDGEMIKNGPTPEEEEEEEEDDGAAVDFEDPFAAGGDGY